MSSLKLLLSFLSLFLFEVSNAQLVISWDKIGCQSDEVDKLIINEYLLDGYVLDVCKNSIVTYRISGPEMQNVDHVEWLINGGKVETKDEFAAVNWDETTEGNINFLITFTNGTTIEKKIIIRKIETNLNLGWDKIGCQINVDKVNEIKFDSNHITTNCLKVCKKSKMTYNLSGKDIENIHNVVWTITGAENVNSEGLTTTITWNDSINGAIKIKINFNDSNTLEKTFCVKKLDPSVLLEWEKVDESSIREIKLDNTEKGDCLMIYPESTVFYKIDGKTLENISSVNWEVQGGIAYIEQGLSTPITWFDDEDNYLILHLTYLDGSVLQQKINIMKITAPGGGVNAQNSIKFSYDLAGNQTRRAFIYLASRHSKPEDDSGAGGKKLVRSDVYKDISYYPNPVKSELYVEWVNKKGKEMTSMELYDLTGRQKIILKNMNAQTNTTISFDEYPEGVYTLILNYVGGLTKNLKIVKQ